MTILEQWFDEVWNKRSTEAIDRMWHPTKTVNTLAIRDHDVRTRDDFKRFHSMFLTAYPDLHIEVEDVVQGGDKVVARVRVTGTHTGPGFSDVPTGKPVEFTGMAMVQIKDGVVIESWNNFDFLTMYQQLDLST